MEISTPIIIIIDVAGFLGAIIAIILAMMHAGKLKALVMDMENRNKELEEQHETLVGIEKSISTRYLSRFPFYLSEIVKLIGGAQQQQRITIFCDFPAYGCLSNRKSFLDYRYQLQKKIEQGLEVEITFLDKDPRLGQLWDHFRSRCQNEEFRHHLEEFCAAHRRSIQGLSPQELLSLIEKENITMLEEFLAGAKQFPIIDHVPVYFWLVDEKAIFSIASHPEKTLEHGFVTSDVRLIAALTEMKDRYHRGLPPPPSSLPLLLVDPAVEAMVGRIHTEETIDIPKTQVVVGQAGMKESG